MSEDIDRSSRTRLSEVQAQQGWIERSLEDVRDDLKDVKGALNTLSGTLTKIEASIGALPAIEARVKALEDDVGKIKISQARFAGFLAAAGTVGGGAGALLSKLIGG